MMLPKVGQTVKADYYGQRVEGAVRSTRFHDGYREYVLYLNLHAPRLNYAGQLTDTVMVRASQLVREDQ